MSMFKYGVTPSSKAAEARLSPTEPRRICDIAEDIKKQFKELNAEFVAVRSSATAEDGAENAWAGQLDSYLNTKEENLLEKVQQIENELDFLTEMYSEMCKESGPQ